MNVGKKSREENVEQQENYFKVLCCFCCFFPSRFQILEK